MKKLFLHIKRLFRKFWFVIFLAFAISFVFGLGLLAVMTIISMVFFDNIVDVDSILENFTEEQLNIIFAEKVDENVTDDDYFTILARYQTFLCPKKVDSITTWIGSEVTEKAYVQKYELKKIVDGFSLENQKKNLLNSIDKNSVAAKRAVNSNRSLNFVYTYRNSGETFTITITPDELRK